MRAGDEIQRKDGRPFGNGERVAIVHEKGLDEDGKLWIVRGRYAKWVSLVLVELVDLDKTIERWLADNS